MLRRKVILGTAVCLLAAVFVSQSLSQTDQQGQGQRRQRGQGQATQGAADQGPGGGRQFDPAQMRERMQQRYQQQLGATDEQWKELGPLVMKVQELNQQLNMSGRGGMRRGGQGGQGGQGARPGAQGGTAEEQTALAKATEQLNTLLDDSTATPEKIKELLTTVRTAKENTKKELVTAQKALQAKVTVRQEAQLVLMGMLD